MEQGWELVRYEGENNILLKLQSVCREPFINFHPQELEKNTNLIKSKVLYCLRFIHYRTDYTPIHLPFLLSQNIAVEQTYFRNLERLLENSSSTNYEYCTIEESLYNAYTQLFDFLWTLEIKKTILLSPEYVHFQRNLTIYCDNEELTIIHRNEYLNETDRAQAVKQITQLRHVSPVNYLQNEYYNRKDYFIRSILQHKNLVAAISQCCRKPTRIN
jgi:hypothetical protein